MKPYLFFISILFYTVTHAQVDFELGKILPDVKVGNSSNESFALYLPKDYDNTKLSSIVFVFDPMGNGAYGIKNFIDAAERFNHILVSSNQAKNGPYERNFEITNRLFDHVFAAFNIDPKQIYLSGFSGGSRMVTSIAVLTNEIRAVIACGAGFPFKANFIPTQPKFIYVGIIGNKDMNLREMTRNYQYLDSLNFRHQLFKFDGAHHWPPKESLNSIFTWLDIEAYKDGIKDLPQEQLINYFIEMHNDAIKSIDVIDKLNRLDRLYKTFLPYFKLDSINDKIKILETSKEVKKAHRKRNRILELEAEIANDLIRQYKIDYSRAVQVDLKWWRKELDKINQLALRDYDYSDMAERIKYNMLAFIYEDYSFNKISLNHFQKELYDFIMNEFKK